MNHRMKPWLLGGPTALVAGSLLIGCAHQSPAPAPAADPAPAAQLAPAPAAPAAEDKPGGIEGELVVVTAKVKAIDKKHRVVTLKYPDGKQAKVKCGPEVRNFAQIRVGDDVTAEFLETIELFVTAPEDKPEPGGATVVERAPKGAKPGMATVETVEVAATVKAIDYDSRMVTLERSDGKLLKVKAGPEIKRLNEVKTGDAVVARYTEAMSITVTSPQK